jgi:hypothetical protein
MAGHERLWLHPVVRKLLQPFWGLIWGIISGFLGAASHLKGPPHQDQKSVAEWMSMKLLLGLGHSMAAANFVKVEIS